MHKFKNINCIKIENPLLGDCDTQMWAYRGITALYSRNNQFDLLEFDKTSPTELIRDIGAPADFSAYRYHGHFMEGHIDYWFPLDQAQDCVVFAGYTHQIQYPNNVLSIGFDRFDFWVHEIFSNPVLYNEINRAGVEHAEYDVCIPVGYYRTHRQIFLQYLVDAQTNLKIVTDSRQTVLPTTLTFDSLNMEPYLNKLVIDKFECHITHQSFYEFAPLGLMQMPHRRMHAACRVNVALETTVHETTQPYLTEKTYKILAQARPFVIYGDTNILQKLKTKGFKTFGQFCDESYDQEPNHDLRAKKVVDALQQLVTACHTHPEEINNICKFNQNHYFSQERLHNELADFGQLCLDKVFIRS